MKGFHLRFIGDGIFGLVLWREENNKKGTAKSLGVYFCVLISNVNTYDYVYMYVAGVNSGIISILISAEQ